MTDRIICLAAGYIFGLFQTGYFVGKLAHTDIQSQGSGNLGTTNVARVLGARAGLIVMIGDIGKAVLACTLVRLYYTSRMPEETLTLMLYCGFGVILGHNYPFYLHFKGGKGIAATGGMIIALLDWRVFFICLAAFLLPIIVTRYVSVGSLTVVTVFFALWIIMGQSMTPVLSTACYQEGIIVAALIMVQAFWRHRTNIYRLIHGTENKAGSH